MKIEIPNYKTLEIENIVLDFNGTIAKDGKVKQETKELINALCNEFNIFVITADTNNSVKDELNSLPVTIIILKSDNHTKEKMEFVKKVDCNKTIAIGNGANDELMLKTATIGICLLGNEGCATKTCLASDILCKNIHEALELFLYPKRLIATLRI